MIAKESDWYKHSWSLDIKHQSWVEDTGRQVNFIIDHLKSSMGTQPVYIN